MFLLILILVPIIEVFAFIEVGRAIGWLLSTALLLGTSVLGVRLLRIHGRLVIEQVSLAVAERRVPTRTGIDGTLGLLGSALLVIPGFVTDAIGALLLLPPIRTLTRRWVSRHYIGRLMSFVAMTGRFASGGRRVRPADIESTALDDDSHRLDS
jgi:UPF0716 protein FxsA